MDDECWPPWFVLCPGCDEMLILDLESHVKLVTATLVERNGRWSVGRWAFAVYTKAPDVHEAHLCAPYEAPRVVERWHVSCPNHHHSPAPNGTCCSGDPLTNNDLTMLCVNRGVDYMRRGLHEPQPGFVDLSTRGRGICRRWVH